jgi:hypothetical protein
MPGLTGAWTGAVTSSITCGTRLHREQRLIEPPHLRSTLG